MNQFTYSLESLSSVIVSPRDDVAFYSALNELEADNTKNQQEGRDKAKDQADDAMPKVIYPFYQYGEYRSYAPESAVYYLPGSSIKGALRQGRSDLKDFMVDDAVVPNEGIVLRKLHKFQYLDVPEKIMFGPFFENIGVEMLKEGTVVKGNFYVQDRVMAEEIIKQASEQTRLKIRQMMAYLLEKKEIVQKIVQKPDVEGKLNDAYINLSYLLKEENVLLIGGYKGKLHAALFEKMPQEEEKAAIYLDSETLLPHGLVKMTVEAV